MAASPRRLFALCLALGVLTGCAAADQGSEDTFAPPKVSTELPGQETPCPQDSPRQQPQESAPTAEKSEQGAADAPEDSQSHSVAPEEPCNITNGIPYMPVDP